MSFDDTLHNRFEQYQLAIKSALETVDEREFRFSYDLLQRAQRIFVCGNGGSAAIAEHLSCDHSKGVRTDTNLTPQVISLSSNMAVITAIANDFGYDLVFCNQMKYHNFCDKDLLVMISSSGKSENVIRAAQYARIKKGATISMVGFDGGALRSIFNDGFFTDIERHTLLHVQWNNYGVVEDCHQIMMHILAQALRDEHKTQPLTRPL